MFSNLRDGDPPPLQEVATDQHKEDQSGAGGHFERTDQSELRQANQEVFTEAHGAGEHHRGQENRRT